MRLATTPQKPAQDNATTTPEMSGNFAEIIHRTRKHIKSEAQILAHFDENLKPAVKTIIEQLGVVQASYAIAATRHADSPLEALIALRSLVTRDGTNYKAPKGWGEDFSKYMRIARADYPDYNSQRLVAQVTFRMDADRKLEFTPKKPCDAPSATEQSHAKKALQDHRKALLGDQE